MDWKPVIIGCSVGGFLLILAVVIVITYLCCRSRQGKKLCYERNLSSRVVEVDSGYTTFSLQKPGMPPLPSSAPSHPHGGLWTTQPVTQAQQWSQPIVPVEVKGQSDKKTSSTSKLHQSTDDIHKQSKDRKDWKDRKSSHMHASTESMESGTGSSIGSYGSQTELITRDQKPESKSKSRENKKNHQRRSELLEPDMSVIEEESNVGSKIGQHRVIPPSIPSEGAPAHHQVVRRHHPDESGHPSAPPPAATAEMDCRRTIYPPTEAAVNVDAVIEIQPKQPATRTLTSTSEDKRMILEAFSFLDEFEE